MLSHRGRRRRDLLSRFHKFVSNHQQVRDLSHRPPINHGQPEKQNIDDYFGLATVSILATEKLFHPVLPLKMNGKLMFPLCAKCVEEQLDRPWHERTNVCSHSDEERTMTGTRCTEELKKAAELGYQIIKIHEVWHFS